MTWIQILQLALSLATQVLAGLGQAGVGVIAAPDKATLKLSREDYATLKEIVAHCEAHAE